MLLSWIYDTSPYALNLIEKSPGFFQRYGMDWVGCGWTSVENIRQWAKAVRGSKQAAGEGSKARGLLGTNWGGGRIETGLVHVASYGWNLDQ